MLQFSIVEKMRRLLRAMIAARRLRARRNGH